MVKTAEVDAGAYAVPHRGAGLTHLVQIATDGISVLSVACKRVARDSICEDGATYTDERPTCSTCARDWDKRGRKGESGAVA